MRQIEHYKFGTKVSFKVGGAEGIVTAIIVRETHFLYDINYMVNGEYKSAYCYEYEFEAHDSEKVKIGFHQINHNHHATEKR